MSEETFSIGDFEIPLDQVVTSKIPEDAEVALLIDKAERKTYTDKDTGAEKAYYNLQLRLPDFPGEVIFHAYFLSARNLSNRKATRSWKLFLDALQLPYTTAITELEKRIFIGKVRLDKKSGDYVVDEIVRAA